MTTEVFMDFDEKGNPIISVKGVKGKACKQLTADFEKALGGQIINTTPTEEYNQREVNTNREPDRAHNKR